jgi:aminocarboxymuconate-semialdehyde decarboxylase
MIDIHSHFFPPMSRATAEGFGESWPWLRNDGGGSGTIMCGDDGYRPVDQTLWDGHARLAALDGFAIDRQIICATPILFGYLVDSEQAHAVAVAVNDMALDHCAADRSRLHSLCQVPLQDLRLACDELERSMRAGHVGVQIGNHVGERDLDDGQLIEFLQHCALVDAPVLVHPWDMFGRDRMNRYMLQWLVAMPAETQLSILYLILSGAFERLPRTLKLCFAHGGGSFAYLLGRVDNAWRERDIVHRDCPRPPSSYCDRFATDSAVFSEEALTLLVNTMGEERVLFGTDFPFPLGEKHPGRLITEHAGLAAATRTRLLSQNAVNFFDLT